MLERWWGEKAISFDEGDGVGSSCGRFSHCAVGFAFAPGQKLAVDDTPEGGRPLFPVAHHGRLGMLQVLQVIVGLAHPRLLSLMSPSEE